MAHEGIALSRPPARSRAFERMVAGRYLRAKRQESLVSVISGFSLVGIALGVATLIIVMSVMNGFRAELLGRILGFNGHVMRAGRRRPACRLRRGGRRSVRGIPGVTARDARSSRAR